MGDDVKLLLDPEKLLNDDLSSLEQASEESCLIDFSMILINITATIKVIIIDKITVAMAKTFASNISDVGSQVTISSSQVASASQALAQGSTEQASAIQETFSMEFSISSSVSLAAAALFAARLRTSSATTANLV